tara:strand:+ start:186 stop:659 length:474 start_codon:yes stop_codon:yes gene_type:complete
MKIEIMEIRFDTSDMSAKISAIVSDAMTSNIEKAAKAGAEEALRMLKENMRGPYSLKRLAQMGHPYARRHGSIKVSPSYVVNYQEGDMFRAAKIRKIYSGKTTSTYEIFFDRRIAPHSEYVLQGTKIMLARDLLGRTLDNPIAYKKILKVANAAYRF